MRERGEPAADAHGGTPTGVRDSIALGAGRARLVQELLVESALLAIAGASLGIGFAYACLRFLVRLGPANLPRLSEISLDWRALSFALLLAAISCLFFGLVPAFRSARIAEAIRSVGRAVSLNREGHRTRHVLVVVQVALALVLLISSGLMIRTFQEVSRVDPGFTRPEQVQTLKLMIPAAVAGDAERVARMEHEIMEKLKAIQGVISAGFTSSLPMDENVPDWDGILAEGQTYAGGDRPAMHLCESLARDHRNRIGGRTCVDLGGPL
jgi:hypothetical protein